MYGLPTVKLSNGKRYAIGNAEQATRAAKEAIPLTLKHIPPSLIVDRLKPEFCVMASNYISPYLLVELLLDKLEDEECVVVCGLLEDLDDFIAEVIASCGRGLFLASYDAKEYLLIDLSGVEVKAIAAALDLDSRYLQDCYAYRTS